jgi:hypothetical protein
MNIYAGITLSPPYIMGYAFSQIFGRDRVIPAYIFIALTCCLSVFSMYLLIRKLYGFEAAVIVSTALLFSSREILLYLWGQRHNVTAFAFIPVAIYALYAYLNSFHKGQDKIQYLYVYILLLLATFLIHFSAVVFLIPVSVILIILFSIKSKKMPYLRKNLKHYLIILAILVSVFSPFYFIYFGASSTEPIDLGLKDIGSLFHWLKIPDNKFDMNPAFSQYGTNYIGTWSVALLLIGVLIVLFRRAKGDIPLISGLISLYMMFHLSSFE